MPVKFRVEITRAAEKEVEEIWVYIAMDSPSKASEFILQLERQAVTLEQFPKRCPMIPENEILGTQYRHLPYGNYRTIFRISETTIYVLRIFYSASIVQDF